jgi:hypothetical protein
VQGKRLDNQLLEQERAVDGFVDGVDECDNECRQLEAALKEAHDAEATRVAELQACRQQLRNLQDNLDALPQLPPGVDPAHESRLQARPRRPPAYTPHRSRRLYSAHADSAPRAGAACRVHKSPVSAGHGEVRLQRREDAGQR